MLRDRLKSRITAMGREIDYELLATEVLGIRNAPAGLAKTLVEQALVVGDRREVWTRVGKRICSRAPDSPGVYLLRDSEGAVLYVGKANNLKRRMGAHFAPRRWLTLDPRLAPVADAEWTIVGSEIEALLLEAEWIARLAPKVNVQIGLPSMRGRRIPRAVVQDLVVVLPAGDPGLVTLIAARVDGRVTIARSRRDGSELSRDLPPLWQFITNEPAGGGEPAGSMRPLAPLVYSWLAGRGASATRFEVKDLESLDDLTARLVQVLNARELFTERIVLRRIGEHG